MKQSVNNADELTSVIFVYMPLIVYYFRII